jgi:hypothetical protein
MQRFFRIAAAIGLALLGFAAHADTLNAYDRGWYSRDVNANTYSAQPNNLNYSVGSGYPLGSGSPFGFRNYFAFDLSAYTGQTITSATLHLYNPKAGDPFASPTYGGYCCSADPFETYELHNVATSTALLLSGNAGAAGFADLGDGTLYGSYNATYADNGRFIDITLNAAALADLNAAAGGLFVLGGFVSTIANGPSQTIFGFTNAGNMADTQLLISTAAVPEPGTMALMAAGFGLLLLTVRKRA